MDYKPRFCEVTDLHAVNVGISDILNVTWATYTESRVQMTKKNSSFVKNVIETKSVVVVPKV